MDVSNNMNLRIKKSIIISIVIVSMNISRANDYTYIVKKDDTLTSILYEHNLKPIYGKKGTLAETLRLNPTLKLNGNENKILPNMKIILVNNAIPDQQINKHTEVETNLELSVDNSNNVPVIEQTPGDRHPSDDFIQSFYWSLTPSLSWKNLSSTDDNAFRSSKIDALSNTNYGIGFSYGMHFEEDLDVYSRLAVESVRFIEDSAIKLEKKDFLASRFNVGIAYKKNWYLEIGMNDEFYLTSPAASLVEVKKVSLPEFKLGFQKDFYQYRNAKLAYLLSGTSILPRSTPGFESKFSYGLGVGLEAKLKNQSFVLGYDLKFLKASSNSTDNHSIYWNYIWATL